MRTVLPPKAPLITILEPSDDFTDEPVFDQLLLQQVQTWPTYDTQRWQFDGSKLVQCDLTDCTMRQLTVWDCSMVRSNLSALQLFEASLLRTEFLGCRLTGTQLAEASLKDVVFENCKLNMLSFRRSHLERVTFRNCVLNEADFADASLVNVSFVQCDMSQVNFDKARLRNVDLRQSDISQIKGVRGLRGAQVSPEQLVSLAPLLAAEAGLICDGAHGKD
jgi:uncharacterized protein YjbI with pentapeptide repeats